MFRKTSVENQEPNGGDRSQDEPHPEVGPFVYQFRHSIDSDTDEDPHTTLVRRADKTCKIHACMHAVNFVLKNTENWDIVHETHVYWRSFLFVTFLQLWSSDFAHAHGIRASVTVQRINSEEYTKVEHVISGFASLKFLSVINLTKLFFCFTFSLFGAIVHTFCFWNTVVCSGWLQLGKWSF